MEALKEQIEKRYNPLAGEHVNLSCGNAFLYSVPVVGEKCIDLGCGRGRETVRLAQAVGDSGFVYGIDASSAMIENASHLANLKNVNNIKFIHASFECFDIVDNSIDLVISNCALNHAADKKSVWNKIFRVLKMGGRFVISDIYALEQVSPEFKNNPCAVAECWAGAVTKSEYLETIAASGFSRIEILKESIPYEKNGIMLSSFTIFGKKTIE